MSATACLSFASLDGFIPLIDNGDQMTCQSPVGALPGGEIRNHWHTEGAKSPMRNRLALSCLRGKILRNRSLDRNRKSCEGAEAHLTLCLGERLLLCARIAGRGFGRSSPVAAENRFTQFLEIQTRTLPVTLAGIAADFFCGLEMRV